MDDPTLTGRVGSVSPNRYLSPTIVCSSDDACYLGECTRCAEWTMPTTDEGLDTWWFEWTSKVQKVMVNGKQKMVRKTVKEKINGTTKQLWLSFNQYLRKVFGHTMRMKKQFSAYKHLTEDSGDTTAVVIVDLSDNYA